MYRHSAVKENRRIGPRSIESSGRRTCGSTDNPRSGRPQIIMPNSYLPLHHQESISRNCNILLGRYSQAHSARRFRRRDPISAGFAAKSGTGSSSLAVPIPLIRQSRVCSNRFGCATLYRDSFNFTVMLKRTDTRSQIRAVDDDSGLLRQRFPPAVPRALLPGQKLFSIRTLPAIRLCSGGS